MLNLSQFNDGDCPIWKTPAQLISFESAAGSTSHWVTGFNVKSDRAGGSYSIEKEACDKLGSSEVDVQTKAKLTTWLVNERALGSQNPLITLKVIEQTVIASALSVYERADRLLKFIASKSPRLGTTFHYYENVYTSPGDQKLEMFAQTESIDDSELSYLLSYLELEGFLQVGPSRIVGRKDFVVTPRGYFRLSEIENRRPLITQGFVAMWFDPSMQVVFDEGIEPGITAAGYKAVRIDHKDHNNKIDDEIIAEIRRSRFIVADFTKGESGARGGVYYEAGFAQGLNIPVIYTCRRDQLADVHFDTRQFNHIDWVSPEDLASRLAARISATLGDGPLKNSKT